MPANHFHEGAEVYRGPPPAPRSAAGRGRLLLSLRRPGNIPEILIPVPPPSTTVFQVTREIDFCYGHRVLECPRCGHLHGHNGRASITLQSENLDQMGMVLDFSAIKKLASTWIEQHVDHRMLLQRDDPAVKVLQELGEPLFLMDEPPTCEALARAIYRFLSDSGVPILHCQVTEAT